MRKTKIRIDSTTKQFVKKIHSAFKPATIIFFGSRAAGDSWTYSDYDFIIVSEKFTNVHWLDRISPVVHHWDSDRPVDVLPYTSTEFKQKKKDSSFIQEVVKKGVEI